MTRFCIDVLHQERSLCHTLPVEISRKNKMTAEKAHDFIILVHTHSNCCTDGESLHTDKTPRKNEVERIGKRNIWRGRERQEEANILWGPEFVFDLYKSFSCLLKPCLYFDTCHINPLEMLVYVEQNRMNLSPCQSVLILNAVCGMNWRDCSSHLIESWRRRTTWLLFLQSLHTLPTAWVCVLFDFSRRTERELPPETFPSFRECWGVSNLLIPQIMTENM